MTLQPNKNLYNTQIVDTEHIETENTDPNPILLTENTKTNKNDKN